MQRVSMQQASVHFGGCLSSLWMCLLQSSPCALFVTFHIHDRLHGGWRIERPQPVRFLEMFTVIAPLPIPPPSPPPWRAVYLLESMKRTLSAGAHHVQCFQGLSSICSDNQSAAFLSPNSLPNPTMNNLCGDYLLGGHWHFANIVFLASSLDQKVV